MPQPPDSVPRGGDLIALLEQTHIHKSSLIHVTGPGGLGTLLWLCRRGYEQVGYVRAGQGCPHEEPDALIVAGFCDAPTLESLLLAGPHVRDDGVLILQSHLPSAGGGASDPIRLCLEQFGYAVEHRLHGAHRDLHIARRVSHAWRKAA